MLQQQFVGETGAINFLFSFFLANLDLILGCGFGCCFKILFS
jgi:hypothetical protein